MKTEITQAQFEELTEQQHMDFVNWAVGQMAKSGNYTHPHRSIPDLIQFIDDHVGPGWWHIERDHRHESWRVQNEHYMEFDENGQVELIDALWDVVKFLLGRYG